MQIIYRTLYIVVALLLLVSCESNDNLIEEQESIEVQFTTTLPQELQTRSYGNADYVDILYVQVYDTEGNELMKKSFPTFKSGFDFSIEMAKNQTYKIIFWAQHAACNVYDILDMKSIKMNSDILVAKDFTTVEQMDAFYATATIDTSTKPTIHSVDLVRPLAQVNVGTTIKEVSNAKAKFTISNASTIFHPFDGDVSKDDKKEMIFEFLVTNDKELEVEDIKYNYLVMGYFFASPKGELLDCELTLEGASKNTFSDVSFQANKRTNIVGTFTN